VNFRFEKWVALGNDYVIIERSTNQMGITADAVRAICDRHQGVGADGVLELTRTSGSTVGDVRIVNPDGSDAELSGNGTREAILYMARHDWSSETTFTVGTPSGLLRAEILSPTRSRVLLGQATVRHEHMTFYERDAVHIVIGNPQTAIRMKSEADLELQELDTIGRTIETDIRFADRTNVSLWTPITESLIAARIWERGVGHTQSSGTGATGAAVAHFLETGQSQVAVAMAGGTLLVEIEPAPEGLRIFLTGDASPVFSGTWPI